MKVGGFKSIHMPFSSLIRLSALVELFTFLCRPSGNGTGWLRGGREG